MHTDPHLASSVLNGSANRFRLWRPSSIISPDMDTHTHTLKHVNALLACKNLCNSVKVSHHILYFFTPNLVPKISELSLLQLSSSSSSSSSKGVFIYKPLTSLYTLKLFNKPKFVLRSHLK